MYYGLPSISRLLYLAYKVIGRIYKYKIFIIFINLADNLAYFKYILLIKNIKIFNIYKVINLFKKSWQF